MTPTFHGSGSGGHGFGTGQLRGQSTHEHASLEFYKIMAVEKFSPRLPQSSGHLIQILILSVSSMRVNEKAFGREKVPRYLHVGRIIIVHKFLIIAMPACGKSEVVNIFGTKGGERS